MINADEGRRVIEEFRRSADRLTTLRDLAALFTRSLQPVGVSAYAIGHLGGGNRQSAMYMTTWPRLWIERYAVNAYMQDDPVVAESLVTDEPFTWEELGRRRDITENRVLVSARSFGYSQGFVVPVAGLDGSRGCVALAATRLRMSASDRLWVAAVSLHCFGVAKRLFERATPAVMTPRERDALRLVAQGLDDAAIALALGVTRTSAHVYVERAKKRLGATTRAQAVALALGDGLL